MPSCFLYLLSVGGSFSIATAGRLNRLPRSIFFSAFFLSSKTSFFPLCFYFKFRRSLKKIEIWRIRGLFCSAIFICSSFESYLLFFYCFFIVSKEDPRGSSRTSLVCSVFIFQKKLDFFYPNRRIYLYVHILFTIAILVSHAKTAAYLLLIIFLKRFSVSRKKKKLVGGLFFVVYDLFHSRW